MKVTILGARGSIATSGRDVQEFGGATSCVLVETDKEAVFIDAGTGTLSPSIAERKAFNDGIPALGFDIIPIILFFVIVLRCIRP